MILIFVPFFLVLVGSLTCLAVATDPNARPSRQRQRLLPIGLALLFAGVWSVSGLLGFDYVGDVMDSHLPRWLGSLAVLGVSGLGTIGLGALGFWIGRRRNRKLGY